MTDSLHHETSLAAIVRDDFDHVVHELLREQPRLAREKAEALAGTILGRPASNAAVQATADRPIIDADLAVRCLAVVVDLGCLAVLWIVIAGLVAIVTHLQPPFNPAILPPAITVLYFLGCWGTVGATPGMFTVDLRLVTADGRPIGFRRAVLRLSALGLGCIPFGASFVSSALSRTNRSWQDVIAGTHLISLRDRRT